MTISNVALLLTTLSCCALVYIAQLQRTRMDIMQRQLDALWALYGEIKKDLPQKEAEESGARKKIPRVPQN